MDVHGRREGRIEHQAEGFDQSDNVSSRVPPNLETISSKEEMKNAGGDRPHPYQLRYFLLGRPIACAGKPSMMNSVQP
jgi:hypothetical protein